jgi:hypothetical protein
MPEPEVEIGPSYHDLNTQLSAFPKCYSQDDALNFFFTPSELAHLIPGERRELWLRLTSNPLSLCIADFFGVRRLKFEEYSKAVELYCPKRCRFSKENCDFGAALVKKLNRHYREGYTVRHSDLEFSNPADAHLAHAILKEMQFTVQKRPSQPLSWYFRDQQRSALRRIIREYRKVSDFPKRSEPRHEQFRVLHSEMCKAGVVVAGLCRGNGLSNAELESQLWEEIGLFFSDSHPVYLDGNGAHAWPSIAPLLSSEKSLVIFHSELLSVPHLLFILHTAEESKVASVVLHCDLEIDTETCGVLRSSPRTVSLRPVQILGPASSYYPEFSVNLGLQNVCYSDARYFNRGKTVQRIDNITQFQPGFPLCWVDEKDLASVLRTYCTRLNPISCAASCQLVVETLSERKMIWSLIKEVMEANCYLGMKLKFRAKAPANQEDWIDPLKPVFVCQSVHQLPDESIAVKFFNEAKRSQPTVHTELLARMKQHECVLIDQLSRNSNHLILFYTSRPLRHRLIRRLSKLAKQQVLLICSPENIRGLDSM